jgi:hypothetical protein
MAGWFKVVSAIAAILMAMAGGYYMVFDRSWYHHIVGAALTLFGISGFVDTMMSRIIVDEHSIQIVSLVRRRTYARSEFESAKVDGGQVCLKRRDGGWLILPGTGSNALSMRNTIDAWIKKQKGQETDVS